MQANLPPQLDRDVPLDGNAVRRGRPASGVFIPSSATSPTSQDGPTFRYTPVGNRGSYTEQSTVLQQSSDPASFVHPPVPRLSPVGPSNTSGNFRYSSSVGNGGFSAASNFPSGSPYPAPGSMGLASPGSPTSSVMGGIGGPLGFGSVPAASNNRTVYLGGLPPNATYEDILNHVKFGPVEQVKIIEDKNCAFVSFIESSAALNFYLDCSAKHIHIGGLEAKVGWGKPSICPSNILAAVQSGATRNVFLGNTDETFTEQSLAADFSRFGPVDQIRVLPERRIAFVHMASVAAAMKAVANLPLEPRYSGRRVNYGKDRTIYLGGVHAEATVKDICDVVRGGILQNVKYLPDKNIAFVTFVDPGAAYAFHHRGTNEGVVIKGKRVKVGWGKQSGLPLSIAAVVQTGASRNVYFGSIDETITEGRLLRDLAEFGEVEMVNIIPDKSIAFANFTDILSAVRAVEALRARAEYASFKVGYGKDRCGNPLRPPPPRDHHGSAATAAGAPTSPVESAPPTSPSPLSPSGDVTDDVSPIAAELSPVQA
ncbi:hypothetical protein HK405_006440 [Cladochytrium tenue]|nr:hypothetical protein HK405_006440 [Cladochytrium tenue]